MFQFDALGTLMLALLCLLFGTKLKQKIYFFERFCIPSPVIGGFLVSLLIWFSRELDGPIVTFDTALQSPLMVAFFTTVGIGGSYRLLKTGGLALITYLVVCWVIAFYQNILGAWLASIAGLHPVLGVMAGSVSLEGGHGAAAAFGSMAEQAGVSSALTAGMAAATFGLIAGGLLGGPIANFLIKKHRLSLSSEALNLKQSASLCSNTPITYQSMIRMMAFIVAIMVVGLYLSKWFTAYTGFALPSYVGAMLVALVVRNLNDLLHWIKIEQKSLDLISDISLGIFLTMAMMSLRIWELSTIALPLLLILVVQVAVLVLLTIFIVFRILGKNYDAAVMCAGLIGHGLGATPNAVANMSSVCQKYGVHSPKAFLIIPLCGAVLIDIVAIPWCTYIINWLLAN